jgi:uroporphyrinogen-III decarboxylase
MPDKFPKPDFARIARAKQRLRDVWAYRRVDRIPVFIRISGRLGHTRREMVEDGEVQYRVNKDNLERSLRTLPDDYIPYARVWHGYMTIATLFGLPVHWADDPEQSPGVAHPLIHDMEQVYSLAKLDARRDGIMPDNLRLQQVFAERFPQWVHLTGFDLGGPLNTCRDLVEGNLLYTAMVDQPEALHHLLSLVTQVQIACYEAAVEASGGLERLTCIDMAQIWAPEGHKGFVSDDVCATVGPSMFETFSKPYNNRIFARWPGGLMHNCGPNPAAGHYLDHTPPINGINCSFRYTHGDFPKLREAFAGRGIVQAMFDSGETAEEMIEGFRHMMETLAPDTIGLPMPIVNDDWSDAEIADLWGGMAEIGREYAASLRWREDGAP